MMRIGIVLERVLKEKVASLTCMLSVSITAQGFQLSFVEILPKVPKFVSKQKVVWLFSRSKRATASVLPEPS